MNPIIAIASDHAYFEYKAILKSHRESKGIQAEDFGAYSTDSVDYPDFFRPTAAGCEQGYFDCWGMTWSRVQGWATSKANR